MLIVQPGITLLLINLSGNTMTEVTVTAHAAAAGAHKHGARMSYTTAQVSVTNQAAAAATTGEHKHDARRHGRKFGHVHAHAHAQRAAAAAGQGPRSPKARRRHPAFRALFS